MICFGTLIFFSLTGLTLNHPTWFGASEFLVEDVTGTLPLEILKPEINQLSVVEQLRKDYRLKGSVKEFEVYEADCMVVFKGPGYAADIFIDRETGNFDLTETKAGFVAIINDLHKGRDTGTAWSWVIDISAIVILLSGFSGIGLLFYIKRRRTSGLQIAALGTFLLIAIYFWFVP